MTGNVVMRGGGICCIVLWGMAGPALADMIRFGYSGSIFGGSSWEIRPDDRVVYEAYFDQTGLSARPEWVWIDKDAQIGRITFAIPGSYTAASEIVTRRIGEAALGAAPGFASNCTDAGMFSVEVAIAGLDYAARVDNCIPADATAPQDAKAHYAALRATTDEIVTTLGLDKLTGQ